MALDPKNDHLRDALAAIINQACRRERITIIEAGPRAWERNEGLTLEQVMAREILERFDAMMLMAQCAFGSGDE